MRAGASPAGVRAQGATTAEAARLIKNQNPEVFYELNENVHSALYQSAMKGNAQALSLWMKHMDQRAEQTMEELSDQELFELCKANSIPIEKSLLAVLNIQNYEFAFDD